MLPFVEATLAFQSCRVTSNFIGPNHEKFVVIFSCHHSFWVFFSPSLSLVLFFATDILLPLTTFSASFSNILPFPLFSAAKNKPIIAEAEIHGGQSLEGVTGFLLLMSEGLIKALESAHGPEQANQVQPHHLSIISFPPDQWQLKAQPSLARAVTFSFSGSSCDHGNRPRATGGCVHQRETVKMYFKPSVHYMGHKNAHSLSHEFHWRNCFGRSRDPDGEWKMSRRPSIYSISNLADDWCTRGTF